MHTKPAPSSPYTSPILRRGSFRRALISTLTTGIKRYGTDEDEVEAMGALDFCLTFLFVVVLPSRLLLLPLDVRDPDIEADEDVRDDA